MVIQHLSTRLIKPNFCFDLPHRRSTTVFLETRNPDWLRACQLIPNGAKSWIFRVQKDESSAESWNWVQKREIKLIDRKVAKEKLTDGQSNLLFSNQAHALDGAIFPWLRDTRAFLLLNHLEIFSYILLSNHVIFLVQFGINKHSPKGRVQFVVFEKFTRAYLFQIAFEIVWLPIRMKILFTTSDALTVTFNRPFPSSLQPLFQSEAKSEVLWRSVFIHIESRTNYHNRNFALSLALKKRLMGSRNGLSTWSVVAFQFSPKSNLFANFSR